MKVVDDVLGTRQYAHFIKQLWPLAVIMLNTTISQYKYIHSTTMIDCIS